MAGMAVPMIGRSCHNYDFCHDKYVFVATKHVFCHEKHVFVATKTVIVAAPASDRYQLLNHIVEVRGAVFAPVL